MTLSRAREPDPIPDHVEEIAGEVVDAAVAVHRALGPGLVESLYQQALSLELEDRELEVASEVPVKASYSGVELDGHYRLDLVVEDAVVLELKVVEQIHSVHEAQLLTYLHLTGIRVGFLLNFQMPLMRDGIHRRVL